MARSTKEFFVISVDSKKTLYVMHTKIIYAKVELMFENLSLNLICHTKYSYGVWKRFLAKSGMQVASKTKNIMNQFVNHQLRLARLTSSKQVAYNVFIYQPFLFLTDEGRGAHTSSTIREYNWVCVSNTWRYTRITIGALNLQTYRSTNNPEILFIIYNLFEHQMLPSNLLNNNIINLFLWQ